MTLSPTPRHPRGPPLLSTLLAGSLALLFPLGVYCLVLSRFNGRRRPVLVPGAWDFALLLFATSGLLLFLGPGLLTGFEFDPSEWWLRAVLPRLRDPHDRSGLVWAAGCLAYLTLALAVPAGLLLRRRRVSCVYNATEEEVADALRRVAASQGWVCAQAGRRLALRRAAPAAVAVTAGAAGELAEGREPAGLPAPTGNGAGAHPVGPPLVVRVEPFAPLRHVTVRWADCPAGLRCRLERALAAELAEVETRPARGAVWLAWGAAFILLGLFASTTLLQVLIIVGD